MWDHKIEMKEGFEPKSFKNYNLTPEEQKEFWTNSLMKTWKKGTFDHLNPLWLLPSSSSKRKMGNYDLAKIIGI